MSDKDEIIAEEIYEYYQDKLEDPQPDEAAVPEPEPEQKKSAFGWVDHTVSEITEKVTKNPGEKTGLYITLAVLVSVTIILCGCIVGILIPKNTDRLESEIEILKSSDKRYSEAVKNNDRLNERVNTLYGDEAEVKAKLNSISDYESMRDNSAQDIEDINAQLDEINGKIESKQSELDEIDDKIKDMGAEITLKPGMYTVGVHIAVGEYLVKGDGSMLVSDSDSKIKVNTKLAKTAAYTCQLSDGDIIKLETKAEFNPAE